MSARKSAKAISAAKFFKENARGKSGELVGGLRQQFMPVPPFLRLPKPKERCPYTGLSRTTLAEICVPTEANNFNPPVRAKCLKSIATKKGAKPARGKKRGIYLIPSAALFEYLSPNESSSSQQAA
ncbi:MAG: hypothetical protein WA183_06345 [Chthoniobacterales bacterium]